MRKIIFNFIALCAGCMLVPGCIEKTTPTQFASASQVGVSESALEALSNSTAAFMYAYDYFGTLSSQEFGYPAMMIIRDALTDCPYRAPTGNYNHFNSYWCSLTDFSVSSRMKQPWRYYYRMILNANNTIFAVEEPDNADEKIQRFYGNALVYRAMSYLDLMRMYEYKQTGIAALDNEAQANGAFGLTVPIIDEHFGATNADNNPRVPFYVMYRFIMNDLNRAEQYLTGYTRPSKVRADLSVVHAYKARLWLEIATRFQKYPEDLATQLAHEDDAAWTMYAPLGITSANDCYTKARDYARLVTAKYVPLTKTQWHSTTNGFNDMSVASWVFAISISTPDAVPARVNCFQSNCVTEYNRGYSRMQYKCYRRIDKNLYDQIGANDWRKVTWIDPADAGRTPRPAKYYTLLSDAEWADRNSYVGFKFRPNEGNNGDPDYTIALMVDYPVIRVEEMYFIEAEAMAYADGLGAGVAALTSFMDNYRYEGGNYNITPAGVDDFVDNYLVAQKRIELWGEGLAYFDIKRRELALTRGYTGTNWLPANTYNSRPGYTPSWLNLYVPNEGEATVNKAIILNPDPLVVDSYGLWPNNNKY